MDMRGDHRRPRVVDEPKRTPWLAIILLILAAVALWSVVSQLGLGFRLREVIPAQRDDLVEVVAPETYVEPAEADPAQDPNGPGAGAATPRWEVPPVVGFPVSGLSQGEGRVELNCRVRDDRTLGDCRIVEESPEGHGFGQAALAGAGKARVQEGAAGAQVQFTVRFVLED